jgi:hypothetical protein
VDTVPAGRLGGAVPRPTSWFTQSLVKDLTPDRTVVDLIHGATGGAWVASREMTANDDLH